MMAKWQCDSTWLVMVFSSLTLICFGLEQEQRCRDGSPALIQCVPLSRWNPSRVEFVCEAQPSFVCEPLGDRFYCCAPIMRLPPKLASARNLHTTDFIATTTVSSLYEIIQKTTMETILLTTNGQNGVVDNRETCVDRYSKCAFSQPLCTDHTYQRMLAIECAKTCGFCSAGVLPVMNSATCVDRGKDCRRAKFLCNLKVYSALMSQECAKTCGKCVPRTRGNESGKEISKKEEDNRENKLDICKDNHRRCYS